LALAHYQPLFISAQDGDDLACLADRRIARFLSWLTPVSTQFRRACAKPDGLFPDDAEPIELLGALLAQAAEAVARAQLEIDPEELRELRQAVPRLLSQLPHGEALADDAQAGLLIDVAKRLDYEALGEALSRLLVLADDALLQRLAKRLAGRPAIARPAWLDPHFQGPLLAAQRTPFGLLLIGAAGDNLYAGEAAFILDLGGDDSYALNPAERLSVIVDLAGADRYLSAGLGVSGAALGGVGLLVDQAGDDVYAGGALTQGGGLLGFAALIDKDGDDLYSAQELAQGAGLFGLGLLIDGAGDDRYSAARFAQGFGGPFGHGLLLDLHGDDRYLAGGKQPSSYGTAGRFQAFSQGVGMGAPGWATGGIGVLQDAAGDEHYVGANFAQGVGYYFGAGLLQDGGGADRYTGARYAQGAAAHLGAGLLIEQQGADAYFGQTAAHAGGAWDLSIAGLIDCGGNDRYHTGELSLGAGEQNALGFFYEHEGADRYRTSAKGLGFSGRTDYADGRNASNAGLFLDRGGDADQYQTRMDASNNSLILRQEFSVFQDQ
jgi:hypothetical protein